MIYNIQNCSQGSIVDVVEIIITLDLEVESEILFLYSYIPWKYCGIGFIPLWGPVKLSMCL